MTVFKLLTAFAGGALFAFGVLALAPAHADDPVLACPPPPACPPPGFTLVPLPVKPIAPLTSDVAAQRALEAIDRAAEALDKK
jgi:hypothetical protein